MPAPLRALLGHPHLTALRQRRWFKPATRALAALLGVWALSWLSVPALVKGPLERLASEQLGRTVTVGSLDFKPWSLELTLRDIAVAGAKGIEGPAQLTIGRVYVDAELQSLLRLAPVVDAFTVENPVLRLTHLGQGRYDVDDVIAKLAAPKDEPAPPPSTEPARLALYNLLLQGGRVDFTDNAVGKTHSVQDLLLSVPFISTLSDKKEVRVEPRLAFTLEGSRFDSSAQSTPFAQTRHADAHIRWDDLDLAPYLGYLPASLPIQLKAATLDVDVKLAFEQTPRLAVKLSGQVQTRDVKMTDREGQDLLAFDRLTVDMADVRPLEQVVNLAQVELLKPVLHAQRDAAGRLNLAQLAGGPAPASPPKEAASQPAKPSTKAAPPWAVTVARASVRDGTVHWADQTTQPAAALQARGLGLELTNLALPLQKPVAFKGDFVLPAVAAQGVPEGKLAFEGEATTQNARVQITTEALALQLAAPYVAQHLEPTVAGQLTGTLGVQWQAPPADKNATGLTVTAGPLALEQLALRQNGKSLVSLGKLEVKGLQVPVDKRTVSLESLALNTPTLAVERGSDGRWMFERWAKVQAQTPTPASETTAAKAATDAPWVVRVGELALQGGAVAFADNAQPRPVALEVSALDVSAKSLATDSSKPGAFTLSARAAAGKGNAKSAAGKIDYQGTLALQPLATQGKLDATRVPVHGLDGYLAQQLAIELLRADVGFRGQVAFAQSDKGPSLKLAGDAAIEELKANSTAASTPMTEAQVGEELLAWKSLNLRGLNVATAPGTAPKVQVGETSLQDFFARITINEAGRINLRDIVKGEPQTPPVTAATAAASAPVPSASAASATQPVHTAARDPLAPVVQFGPMSLVNGKVLFSDFFIKPNYSADLTELTGKLGAFSSEAPGSEPQLAALELLGRAEGSASLEVSGQLNPLAQPLALDIAGKVRDLDLPPLSPYSVKYAGHGIERGKLSVDVTYKVLPNGQLTASNRIVLNQLTFGEPVAGAPNSLPVRLAAALLADRRGVIDLDLPISGSLNDPQFRIGPVIGKIILNLIGKALTSPFSLLASAFGGGEEMSSVAFAPGSATLSPEAQQNLGKVAKALVDRPALKLTVTGTANLEAEREGLQRERLQQLVRAEKRRAQPDSTEPVTADEYPALLKAAYGRASIPKPRNLVGIAKDLTVPEMEALLMANQPATEAMAAELAAQRGHAIQSYLAAQKLPAERLFLAAPKTGSQVPKGAPQAELSLATQ
ncbi:uncharacterized protein involved in outer membrane biogenesis [Acidovorax temperans]|uniref:Uncharacterized protein involved in outer membrane biogenesis n=1 Tax=Acidovorax temperans TaxID=80878 RepID=A0A543L8D1_9BURK|nr:DUF748 domain-containing protein [Acidovorax temperans]TQN03591.1 uncharacterized protein involved in outer membrane biogenesis [Acidovorax temperans]